MPRSYSQRGHGELERLKEGQCGHYQIWCFFFKKITLVAPYTGAKVDGENSSGGHMVAYRTRSLEGLRKAWSLAWKATLSVSLSPSLSFSLSPSHSFPASFTCPWRHALLSLNPRLDLTWSSKFEDPEETESHGGRLNLPSPHPC